MRMLDMANDSGLFRTAAQLTADGAQRDGPNWIARDKAVWVPLYEAKMVHQFDHRWATYEDNGSDSRDMTDAEKCDPASFAQPRYWIKESDKESALGEWASRSALLGWRRISNTTNERTTIAFFIPPVGAGDSVFLLHTDKNQKLATALNAGLNSIVSDWVTRQKMGGTNLSYYYMRQLAVLSPDRYTPTDLDFIVPRVLELTYTAHDLAPFARDLGYDGPPFSWNPERRALLRAELDAYYAKLYGLTRDELRYILDPADIYGDDYPSETFRVLKNNETRQFGEYRTRRLVLEAWDRLHQ
jgi:hypothetical protein